MKHLLTLSTRSTRTLGMMGLLSAMLVTPLAHTDESRQYQPQVLIQAEQALAQGNPQRALALMHRQRAILGHSAFHERVEFIACEAQLQLWDSPSAEQTCDTSANYGGHDAIASLEPRSGD